jgi:glycosyltransferase involved in cell wall biosynthesis
MSGSRVDDVARADGAVAADAPGTQTLTSSSANGRSGRTGWPSLEADLELLGTTSGQSRPARVAIASYEFNGIVRNGGIGTACTSLAKALAAEGHEVDLFFTGWGDDPSEEGFRKWEQHYARLGMRLHWFDYGLLALNYDAPVYSAAHSRALYEQLREHDAERPFDVIHFVESVGHGFYSLQAKRQGLAFHGATTVVGVHSPRRWMAEAHGVSFDSPEYLGDELLERRSVELADVVVSPSAHMLDWLVDHGVRLPERSYVQQYVSFFDRESPAPSSLAPVEELVFFGRLEQRKGLPAFCDALDQLVDRRPEALSKVTFLGRHSPIDGVAGGVASSDYLAARTEWWPWDVEVIADLDRDDALDYLGQAGRLAVMASPVDNSPNTVYEAIGLGIPFLASNGGGIAELVHPEDRDDLTYDPCDPSVEQVDPAMPNAARPSYTGETLAECLADKLGRRPRAARFAVAPEANREVHLAWHRAIAGLAPGVAEAVAPHPNGGPPLVVVDLGDETQGGAGRDDDFILLVDPGVERAPRLAAELLAAAQASKAVLVTSLGRVFMETPTGEALERDFLPTGGPASFGVIANCFGAGVLLARRSTLDRLGALDGSPGTDVAGVLARAALVGERIDIVPEVLYRAPAVREGPLPSLSLWGDPSTALRPYHQVLGADVATVASVAWRLARERDELRSRAEIAEQVAADATLQLGVITRSRSWRLTGWLRRVGSRLRRPGR